MKAFFTFLLLTTFSMAGLLNAIALTVNDKAITLYDIDRVAQQQGISKQSATAELIREEIAKELADLYNIVISKREITAHIKKTITQSGLDMKGFKQNLAMEGITYNEYFNQLYMQKLQNNLIRTITNGKISQPTEQEKLNFFNQHISEFSLPETISVIEYSTSNRQSLINIQRSPMFSPQDVTQKHTVLEVKKLNQKLVQLLLSSKVKSYTKIIPLSINSMGMFYIKKFGKKVAPEFKAVEQKLIGIMMTQKRKTFVNNFFEDQMRKAHINYIKIKPLDF